VLDIPIEGLWGRQVFVMAEEPELRKNRLTLLKCIADLPSGVMDFSELPGY
jgi:glycyl-tRNA synthetase